MWWLATSWSAGILGSGSFTGAAGGRLQGSWLMAAVTASDARHKPGAATEPATAYLPGACGTHWRARLLHQ